MSEGHGDAGENKGKAKRDPFYHSLTPIPCHSWSFFIFISIVVDKMLETERILRIIRTLF